MLKTGLAQGTTCQLIRLLETIRLKPETLVTNGSVIYKDLM